MTVRTPETPGKDIEISGESLLGVPGDAWRPGGFSLTTSSVLAPRTQLG
jgi:hypothetical protein